MSAKLGICYCKVDIVSTCVAKDRGDQFMCDYWEKHSFMDRCTHCDPDNDNHCWSFQAQDFGKMHGVITKENRPATPQRYIAPEAAAPTREFSAPAGGATIAGGPPRNTCERCSGYPMCPLLPQEAAALGKGLTSLDGQDYWNIGSGCPHFDQYPSGKI